MRLFYIGQLFIPPFRSCVETLSDLAKHLQPPRASVVLPLNGIGEAFRRHAHSHERPTAPGLDGIRGGSPSLCGGCVRSPG